MAKITYGSGGNSNTRVNAAGEMAISPIMKDEDGNEVNIVKTLQDIQKRLLILEANFEAHEQYPALKEAYEHYKLMEDLLLTGNKDAKGN